MNMTMLIEAKIMLNRRRVLKVFCLLLIVYICSVYGRKYFNYAEYIGKEFPVYEYFK